MSNDPLISPAMVIRATSRAMNVPVEAITGNCRRAHIVRARHLAMYVCRVQYGHSYPRIGRDFSRDHSTVISGIEAAQKRLSALDRGYMRDIVDLVDRGANEIRRQAMGLTQGLV